MCLYNDNLVGAIAIPGCIYRNIAVEHAEKLDFLRLHNHHWLLPLLLLEEAYCNEVAEEVRQAGGRFIRLDPIVDRSTTGLNWLLSLTLSI